MPHTIHPADDPGAAYNAIWAPLLAFNQKAVGEAEGVPVALVIRAPGSEAVDGGLWSMSLWRLLRVESM